MQLISTIVSLASLLATADAHVTANPSVAQPGSYFAAAFRVPHGCGKSPTVNVTIVIPDDILSVTPQAVPGWKLTFGYRPLDTPIPQEDGSFKNTTVASVSYTGNVLAADQYTDFGLSLKLPASTDNNNTLYFPTYQICQNGSNLWIGIPGQGNSTSSPAPKVTLSNSTSSSSGSKGSSAGLNAIPTAGLLMTSLFVLFTAL